MTKREFEHDYKQLCKYVAADLVGEGMRLFNKLTDSEICLFSCNETQITRLGRCILLAVVNNGRINDQFNVECIKGAVKTITRIHKDRD